MLSHYRLDAKIGEGGMGEVWKATDTTLGRPVAIKILPEAFSADPERLARFEREAKLLASLNHPGIAVIHGLHRSEGIHFLAMELVAGEDLAARLGRGALPPEEALAVAKQVAEAVEAAHESGVIHRDLKPANILLTSGGKVKVLDFGLAKALEAESAAGNPSLSPTVTSAGTRAGMILGTAAYMSPEQARGRPVDRRADIWSFGCVLFEMLTGKQPFLGETITDTLAAVVRAEPDWTLLPGDLPARVAGMVKRCLRKEPRERLRDIGDARIELVEALEGGSREQEGIVAAPPPPHRAFAWAGLGAGVLLGGLLTLAAVRLLAPALPAPALRRLTIPVSQLDTGFSVAPAISPDGRRLIYSGGGRLWLRDLQQFEAVPVPDSEGAITPFWSPDGSQVGFGREKKLYAWPLSGGQSTLLCAVPAPGDLNGAAWGRDGRILFAIFRGGIFEVPERGGDPRLLLSPEPSEVDFHFPEFLPDSRHLVLVAHRREGPDPVVVITADGKERKDLRAFPGLASVTYAPSGHLLLSIVEARQQILAAPFSASRLEFTGEPFLVAAGGVFPSVSAGGLLVYTLGSRVARKELVWVDHAGRTLEVVGQPQRGLDMPALSPDGRKVALAASETDNADIWIQDLTRGTRSRLVSSPQDDLQPVWSPSGDRIFYLQQGNFLWRLMEVSTHGAADPRSLGEGNYFAPTPDGKAIVCSVEKHGRTRLWTIPLPAGAPAPITPEGSVSEDQPALSPDGRWVAYFSDESGRGEVFVRGYPGGGGKQQVSINGGAWPLWSRKGDALYYWERGLLMEVPVRGGSSLTLDAPRRLFAAGDVGLRFDFSDKPPIDVAADGRFLLVRRWNEDPQNGLLLVENWLEEFRKP